MSRSAIALTVAVAVVAQCAAPFAVATALAGEPGPNRDKDPSAAPRFPGATMTGNELQDNPDLNAMLHVKDGLIPLQGTIRRLSYHVDNPKITSAAVVAHYRSVLGNAGGTVVHEVSVGDNLYLTVKFVTGVDETWYEVSVDKPDPKSGIGFSVTVVETKIESARPEQTAAQLAKHLERMTVLLATIEWEPSGAISASSVRHVRPIAQLLREAPALKLKLVVHSPDPADQELVDKRAAAVRAFFKQEGLAGRVTVAGAIDKQPLFGSETDPVGRKQNRALTLARSHD